MISASAKLNLLKHRPLDRKSAESWLIVSASLVAMIYTGSKALQYLTIALFTIFKNLTIIIIAYSERLFFNGAPVNGLMLVSFFCMVLSSILAGWADIRSGNLYKNPSNLIISYMWMFTNCLTTAFFALIMRSRIKHVGFKDFDTVYYNNLLSIPILLVVGLATEVDEFYRVKEKYLDGGEEWVGLVLAILVSSVASFAISYGSSWCVRVTSSTTFSMVGALNKLPLSVFGLIFFGDTATVGGVGGIIIAFIGGLVYSYAKNSQKNMETQQQQQAEPLIPFSNRNAEKVRQRNGTDELELDKLN